MFSSEKWRGVLIGSVSVVVSAAAVYFCHAGKVLWVLAPLPGLVGVMYHLLNLQPRYANRVSVAELYRTFVKTFNERWGMVAALPSVSEDEAEDLSAHEPKFSSTLWAAALLTAVLMIPAAVSGGGLNLAFVPKTAAANATALPEAEKGLVLAGLGVYALIVLRTIGRLNAGALHARFMITAALRATVAQVLGLFAGATSFFSDSARGGGVAYFLIGLFYPLFVETLRDEAITLFRRKKEITNPKSTRMIEGIDDDVADILTELSVTDVQNVASSDPAVLTVRSLYPFQRVTDWINQALLIDRFGDSIASLRALHIRGIVDFIPLMDAIVNDTAQAATSRATLQEIAKLPGETLDTVTNFAAAAYENYKVNLLWQLSQHRFFAKQQPQPQQDVTVGADGPRIQVQTSQATPLPAQVSQLVARAVQAELDRIAVDDATKFRAENPDASVAAADYVQSTYDKAYALALQRATLGVNPKPSARARAAYEEAFKRALA
jgi:hypothetical protein